MPDERKWKILDSRPLDYPEIVHREDTGRANDKSLALSFGLEADPTANRRFCGHGSFPGNEFLHSVRIGLSFAPDSVTIRTRSGFGLTGGTITHSSPHVASSTCFPVSASCRTASSQRIAGDVCRNAIASARRWSVGRGVSPPTDLRAFPACQFRTLGRPSFERRPTCGTSATPSVQRRCAAFRPHFVDGGR